MSCEDPEGGRVEEVRRDCRELGKNFTRHLGENLACLTIPKRKQINAQPSLAITKHDRPEYLYNLEDCSTSSHDLFSIAAAQERLDSVMSGQLSGKSSAIMTRSVVVR